MGLGIHKMDFFQSNAAEIKSLKSLLEVVNKQLDERYFLNRNFCRIFNSYVSVTSHFLQ